MTPDERAQVESVLGRAVSDDELTRRVGFEDLAKPQLDIVRRLFEKKAGPTAEIYVRNVVPEIERDEIERFVVEFDRFMARAPQSSDPPKMRMRNTYEAFVGRQLTVDERRRQPSLQALSPAQLEVAKALAIQDTLVAHAYLGEIVQSASSYEREMLAETLARS
jgi:hypothetical protein